MAWRSKPASADGGLLVLVPFARFQAGQLDGGKPSAFPLYHGSRVLDFFAFRPGLQSLVCAARVPFDRVGLSQHRDEVPGIARHQRYRPVLNIDRGRARALDQDGPQLAVFPVQHQGEMEELPQRPVEKASEMGESLRL